MPRERNARRESFFKILYVGRRQLLVHHTGVKSREDRFDYIYVTRLNYCLFVFHDLLSLLKLALSGNRACLTTQTCALELAARDLTPGRFTIVERRRGSHRCTALVLERFLKKANGGHVILLGFHTFGGKVLRHGDY